MNQDFDKLANYGGDTPVTYTTADLLTERGKTHGDFDIHAHVTQEIKEIIYKSSKPQHNHMMLESLEMIAHKIGRIMAGDPDFRDHWDDIAGYAKLVADRCTK